MENVDYTKEIQDLIDYIGGIKLWYPMTMEPLGGLEYTCVPGRNVMDMSMAVTATHHWPYAVTSDNILIFYHKCPEYKFICILHEIGHIMACRAQRQGLMAENPDLTEEKLAWVWALTYCQARGIRLGWQTKELIGEAYGAYILQADVVTIDDIQWMADYGIPFTDSPLADPYYRRATDNEFCQRHLSNLAIRMEICRAVSRQISKLWETQKAA